MEKLGTRIKKLRKKLELSQRQVAERIGLTQEAVSQLERFPDRIPSSDTLSNLAKFFQVDPEWLLTGKGQQSPISSLAPEESELILLFRAVSPAARDYLLARVRDVYRDEYDRKSPPSGDGGDKPSGEPHKPAH
jgi:transcriptional regulator with XRE-family HTH domain